MRAKTVQVEYIGSTHGNKAYFLNHGTSLTDHVTRQAVSDSRTAGCTLASGMLLAYDRLIHGMGSPASSLLTGNLSPCPCSRSSLAG